MPVLWHKNGWPPVNEPLVWPDRVRCRRCRRFLDATVLLGMFCSYDCADLPEPLPLAEAPRQCVFGPRAKRRYKARYRSAEEALAHCRDPKMSVYLCGNCYQWHMGHDYSGLNTLPPCGDGFVRRVAMRSF